MSVEYNVRISGAYVALTTRANSQEVATTALTTEEAFALANELEWAARTLLAQQVDEEYAE